MLRRRCERCEKLFRSTLVVFMVIAITLAWMNRDKFDTETIQLWVSDAGVWAPLVFMSIYVVATVIFLPGSIVTLLGGALFGPVLGTFYSLTAATLGATIAFLISRYLAADWVNEQVGGKTKTLIDGVEKEGWRFIAFVRLVPLFPFNLLNYALGLTRISLWQYVIASYIFMLPGSFAYTYLGYAGKEALAGGDDLIQKVLIALALLATVAFIPGFVKRLRGDKDQSPQQDD